MLLIKALMKGSVLNISINGIYFTKFNYHMLFTQNPIQSHLSWFMLFTGPIFLQLGLQLSYIFSIIV